MNKKYFSRLIMALAILFLTMNGALAQVFVNESFAKQIGASFISNQTRNEKSQLTLFHTEKGADGQPNLYIFNVEGGGFVIVSASRNMKPVLAYSLRHSYEGEIPEPAWYFIENYSKNIDYCDANGVVAADAEAQWKALENNELPAAKNAKTVSPLIQTLWNQDYPYNYYAPETGGGWWGGPGGHCYAGCVACAMSQIMKFWNHPVQGNGSHTYTHSTYGQQSANFGETFYNWSIMPNELGYQANDEAKAVALLMYHCGVSVDMNFGPDGSGAYSKDVETAMRQYFGYCAASYRERSKYTEEDWIALLKSELDKSQPVYFSGTSDSGGGHAIVCDGYDSNDYFSFNLGWSGSGNDYYSINDVAGYHNNEAAVVNIVPMEIRSDDNGIIHVAADGTGTGVSWDNATPNLQYATALANTTAKQIWVKSGVYYGDTGSDDGAFYIYKNNRVYGGFAGNEGPDFNLEDRDLEANPTILDGQNLRRVLYQTDHFMNAEYSVWDGFTIQNGNSGAGGGAYLCCNSRFVNCKFLNNTANGFGGAVYAITAYYENSTVRFNNCVFEGNSGSLGGAYCDMMGSSIVNCRFTGNTAQTRGGAYYVYANKEPKIVNSIFDGNNADMGGGLYTKGKITIINCDFIRNHANTNGGGLYVETKYNKIYNSILWGNTAAANHNQIVGTSQFNYCGVEGGCNGGHIINLAAENEGLGGQHYPCFADPDNGDYSFGINSACVNAGDKSVSGIVNPDYLGQQRVVDGQIDLGAIECQYYDLVDDADMSDFALYPNPFAGELRIAKDGEMQIEVFNALGQKVASVEACDEAVINTSEWERGVYLIKVNGVAVKAISR